MHCWDVLPAAGVCCCSQGAPAQCPSCVSEARAAGSSQLCQVAVLGCATDALPLQGNDDQKAAGRTVLVDCLEAVRIVAVLIAPVTPGLAQRIFAQLGLDASSPVTVQQAQWGGGPSALLQPPGQPALSWSGCVYAGAGAAGVMSSLSAARLGQCTVHSWPAEHSAPVQG